MTKELSYRFRMMRGMTIAKTRTIRKSGDCWIVPSEAGNGYYLVDLRPKQPTCTCPDHQKHQLNCKHIIAVFYRNLRVNG